MATLKFKLEGRESSCDYGDFCQLASEISDLLRRLFRRRNPGNNPTPRFEISQLKTGSAICEILAEESGALSIVDFVSTINAIRNREAPDLRVTNDDIRAFKKLADPLFSHSERLDINGISISPTFKEDCDWLINSVPASFGQLTGRLEGMLVHVRQYFRLYPEGQDRGVECYFEDALYEKVHAAMKMRVRVTGLIHRDPDGIGIDRVKKVSDIEPLQEDRDLPTFCSLMGLFEKNPVNLGAGWDER